jgi:hypothetical protein
MQLSRVQCCVIVLALWLWNQGWEDEHHLLSALPPDVTFILCPLLRRAPGDGLLQVCDEALLQCPALFARLCMPVPLMCNHLLSGLTTERPPRHPSGPVSVRGTRCSRTL